LILAFTPVVEAGVEINIYIKNVLLVIAACENVVRRFFIL
jgi:hypothetical protein